MGGNLDPVEARLRKAIRSSLQGFGAQHTITLAVSGGADSLALALATSFVAKEHNLQVSAVVIDHGLQSGSAAVATRAASQVAELGIESEIIRVQVDSRGSLEAAAREARYSYLDALPSAAVLLGHTMDDQAETVLMGLGRGSGPRSIAGMRPVNGKYRRPFLGVRRSETEHLCLLHGLEPFSDPHNADARFRRVRIRTEVVPLLDDVLGGGVVPALARTAEQVQVDLDYLDGLVDHASMSSDCAVLAEMDPAIRHRMLRRLARDAGAAEITSVHIAQIDALVTQWRGQGVVDLPGGVKVQRIQGALNFG